MKNLVRSLCILAVCAIGTSVAQAAIVSQWDFNTGTTLPANASSQDSHVTGTPTINPSGSLSQFSITGGALDLRYTGHATDLNNAVLTLTINTSGASFSSFTATYNAGFNGVTGVSGTWSYSVNGGSFVNIGTLETITVGANSDTLTGLALAPGDTLVLHFTLSNGAGPNGNGDLTFDDFTIGAGSITPVPEPVTCSLLAFGLVFVGGGLGRFSFGKLRRA